MFKKKSQAAMEFLMTYGWAILVVLVAIGALAYFGVLNPSRFLPSSCTVGPGIGCDDFKVNGGASGSIQLVLRNGMGNDVTQVAIDSFPSPGTGGTSCSTCISRVGCNTTTWQDGTQLTVVVGGGASGGTCGALTTGSRFKSVIALLYTSAGGIPRNVSGSITSKVE